VSAELEHHRLQTPARDVNGVHTDTILIIDDDEAARYVFKRFLAETSFAIIEAINGPEGLRRARENRPQVIFLDLMMPEMSGFEVLERLKSDPVTRNIPVIIITSKPLKDRDRRSIDGKAIAILSKETASREAAIASMREATAQDGLAKDKPDRWPKNG
jgi:CheY-like chemotaxis protein